MAYPVDFSRLEPDKFALLLFYVLKLLELSFTIDSSQIELPLAKATMEEARIRSMIVFCFGIQRQYIQHSVYTQNTVCL